MKSSQEPAPKKRRTRSKTQSKSQMANLQPLSHYVTGQRSTLVEQLFLAVDADTVKTLLPPTLQEKSLDDLKLSCETQLKKLTDQEILDIFAAVTHGTSDGQAPDGQGNDDQTRTLPEDSSVVVGGGGGEEATKSAKEVSEDPTDVALHLCADQREMDNFEIAEKEKSDKTEELPTEESLTGDSWVESKTEREIMELEFRARAIRSLMRSQGLVVQDDDDEDSAIKQVLRETKDAPL